METKDIVVVVNDYLPNEDYFFMSSISSTWKNVYKSTKNNETSYTRAIESESRMKVCLDTEEGIHTPLCNASCMTRSMKALEWLCQPEIINRFSSGGPSLEYAAYGGSRFLDVVLECFNHNTDDLEVIYEITMGSIRSGDIVMIEKWWKGLTYYWHGCVLKTAASHGTIEVLDWAFEKGYINKKSKLLVDAGKHSRLDIIKWCFQKNIINGSSRMIENASRDGNVSVLDISTSILISDYMISEVIRIGNIDCIASRAARYGQIRVLEWSRDKGYRFGPEAYIGAACSGKYVNQDVVIQCLDIISSVIGTSNINWLFSTIVDIYQKGECEGETLEWFISRV